MVVTYFQNGADFFVAYFTGGKSMLHRSDAIAKPGAAQYPVGNAN